MVSRVASGDRTFEECLKNQLRMLEKILLTQHQLALEGARREGSSAATGGDGIDVDTLKPSHEGLPDLSPGAPLPAVSLWGKRVAHSQGDHLPVAAPAAEEPSVALCPAQSALPPTLLGASQGGAGGEWERQQPLRPQSLLESPGDAVPAQQAEQRWGVLACGLLQGWGPEEVLEGNVEPAVSEQEPALNLHMAWSVRPSLLDDVPCGKGSFHSDSSQNVRFAHSILSQGSVLSLLSSAELQRGGDKKDPACILQPFVLHPDRWPWTVWSFLGLAMLLVDIILNPMEAVGILGPPELAVTLAALCYWMLDLPCQCLTGFHDKGAVELRPSKTARRYMMGWLLPDLAILSLDVCSFALELQSAMSSTGQSLRNLRALRLVRLARLVRAHRFVAVAACIQNRILSEYLALLIRILKLLGLLWVICHYIACAFYGIAVLTSASGPTWLTEYEVDEQDGVHTYFTALHWTLCQFTPATNNIAPRNVWERAFAACVVLFGLVIFSSFISSVTNSVMQMRMLGITQSQERSRIRQFIKHWDVTLDLGQRIQSFFSEVTGNSRKPVMEEDIAALRALPESLRIRLHQEMYMPVLASHRVFDLLLAVDRPTFVRICHEALAVRHFLPRQDVFIEGTKSLSVFCVISGGLQYTMGSLRLRSRSRSRSILGQTSRDKVERSAWISEAALWVHWLHVGLLTARAPCELLEVDCACFRELVVASHGKLQGCFRKYALLFVFHAEEKARGPEPVNDLFPGEEVAERLADRARQFQELDGLYPDVGPAGAGNPFRPVHSTTSWTKFVFGRSKTSAF